MVHRGGRVSLELAAVLCACFAQSVLGAHVLNDDDIVVEIGDSSFFDGLGALASVKTVTTQVVPLDAPSRETVIVSGELDPPSMSLMEVTGSLFRHSHRPLWMGVFVFVSIVALCSTCSKDGLSRLFVFKPKENKQLVQTTDPINTVADHVRDIMSRASNSAASEAGDIARSMMCHLVRGAFLEAEGEQCRLRVLQCQELAVRLRGYAFKKITSEDRSTCSKSKCYISAEPAEKDVREMGDKESEQTTDWRREWGLWRDGQLAHWVGKKSYEGAEPPMGIIPLATILNIALQDQSPKDVEVQWGENSTDKTPCTMVLSFRDEDCASVWTDGLSELVRLVTARASY